MAEPKRHMDVLERVLKALPQLRQHGLSGWVMVTPEDARS